MQYKKVAVATYQKGKSDNKYCGDRYYISERDRSLICVIADGLGSGEIAGQSAQVVIDIIKDNEEISDEALVTKAVQNLAGERGAVFGVLRIDFEHQKYTYSSIGNISLVVTMEHEQRRRIIPRPGFLGHYARKLKVVEGKLERNMGFLMFSDGVSDQELSKLCLFHKDIDQIIQAFSHMSNKVREDDTTLIVMRYKGEDFRADS